MKYYTKEDLVQAFGDGFYDGFKKAMEIHEKAEWEEALYTLLDYADWEVVELSEDAESKFEDNMTTSPKSFENIDYLIG